MKTQNPPSLSIKSLTKRYTRGKMEKLALNEVSFSIGAGLYGLLGPNGAGKSTLINIITGSLTPTSGRAEWCGKRISSESKAFRKILGYMPQQQNLYDGFTGRRFLDYLCALKNVPAKEAEAEVLRVAKSVNLVNELDKKLSAYSGGMKQRLLAAGAIIGEPKLLIFDEPTAGLDPKERVRLREMMVALAAEGRVVLVATHVVSDVESVADQILLLKEGRLVDMAPPTELAAAYAPGKGLEEVYLALFGEEKP